MEFEIPILAVVLVSPKLSSPLKIFCFVQTGGRMVVYNPWVSGSSPSGNRHNEDNADNPVEMEISPLFSSGRLAAWNSGGNAPFISKLFGFCQAMLSVWVPESVAEVVSW
jgi:hypothetical protein